MKQNKRIDDNRALLITNATIKMYMFWKKQHAMFPNSPEIESIFNWYSNLMYTLPVDYHGWKAFFKYIRFDLKFLDGLTSDIEKYLFKEVKSFNTWINVLLWTPNHMWKKH